MKLFYMLCFGLSFISSAQSASLEKVIKKVKPAIVAIGTHQPTRRPPVKILGTGFVVQDGRHVVTNNHVLPNILNSEKKETIVVISGKGRKVNIHKTTVLLKDPEHDLALLALQGNTLPSISLGSKSLISEGADIAFTGFPIGMVLGVYPVTHRGMISAISPIVIPAISSKQLTASAIRRMRNPYLVYQLDATAYPGNSGSPVYDAKTGKVLGVINSVLVKKTKESALSDPSGISYAIPVKYVYDLLSNSSQN